jgi:hypothetical protein
MDCAQGDSTLNHSAELFMAADSKMITIGGGWVQFLFLKLFISKLSYIQSSYSGSIKSIKNVLGPWCSCIFYEKLMVAQLVKKCRHLVKSEDWLLCSQEIATARCLEWNEYSISTVLTYHINLI